MQCSPPFYGTGYQNYGQFYPCNPPYSHPTPYPEVIGEGEVASVVFPDGSVHFYFIPISKRSSPYFNLNPTQNPNWNNNVGAYYVRSISNPMPTAVFSQQCQKMYGPPYSRPSLMSNCNSFVPPPGFQLKFHNDGWTSTTDLQYFFPRSRGCEWFPITPARETASVQTDVPAEDQNACRTITCTKPCLCLQECKENKESSAVEMVDECNRDKVYRSSSVSSKSSSGKPIKCKNQKCKLKHKKQKKRLARKTSNDKCECREPSATDKAVTTYADQASSCRAQDSNTQTCHTTCACGTSTPILESTVNKADSKIKLKENLKIRSSEKIIGIYETSSSSSSCCCSAAEEGKLTLK